MAEFLNLTPHEITVRGPNGDLRIPASGQIARVQTVESDAGTVAGVPAVTRAFGEIENLPAPREGVAFIVSSMVLGAVSGRDDVVAPDTGPTAVRDEDGKIKAVTRFVKAG